MLVHPPPNTEQNSCRHPINQLIHVIFVPAILLTAFVFASYLDLGAFLPAAVTSRVTPYIGTLGLDLVAALYYAGYYLYLSPNSIGASAAGLVMLGLLASQAFVAAVGSIAWAPCLVLHIIAWIAQVHWGHGIYEKRAPALLDNLSQVCTPEEWAGRALWATTTVLRLFPRPFSWPRSLCMSSV